MIQSRDLSTVTGNDLDELLRERAAVNRSIVLEMIGDLPSAEVKPEENVLFVCKLNPITRSEDLELIFSRFGQIKSCGVIQDKRTGQSLCYAFIEFSTAEECEAAYVKMNNVLIDDRRIKVDFSQSVAKLRINQNKSNQQMQQRSIQSTVSSMSTARPSRWQSPKQSAPNNSNPLLPNAATVSSSDASDFIPSSSFPHFNHGTNKDSDDQRQQSKYEIDLVKHAQSHNQHSSTDFTRVSTSSLSSSTSSASHTSLKSERLTLRRGRQERRELEERYKRRGRDEDKQEKCKRRNEHRHRHSRIPPKHEKEERHRDSSRHHRSRRLRSRSTHRDKDKSRARGRNAEMLAEKSGREERDMHRERGLKIQHRR